MASILANPTHRANLGYNGFDMGHYLKFSSSVGQLIPVFYDYLSPGDKVNLQAQIKTRTMELESAAMVSLTEHLEWFFVPFEQLSHAFGSIVYNISDLNSSLWQHELSDINLPKISLKDVVSSSFDKSHLPSDFTPFFPKSPTAGQIQQFNADQVRLLDALGYSVSRGLYFSTDKPLSQAGLNFDTFKPAPWLLGAYQKIYSDHYRLSDRQVNRARYYNFDFYQDGSSLDSAIGTSDANYICTLQYRPYRKDFFTNTYVSPLYDGYVGGLDVGNSDFDKVNQWLTSVSDYQLFDENKEVNKRSATHSYLGGNTLNVPNIRTLFAIDKMLEITRRAGKHYDKQVAAHFGVSVPTGISGESFFLGSQESRIDIGDVIATAGTESDPLGRVGGKGYGFGQPDKPISFTAPSHGVLMCIYSCEPIVDYTQIGLDRLNSYVHASDFFIPEFDNLGMQPLFMYQYREPWTNGFPTGAFTEWQYRYSELKCKYNRVFGSLSTSLRYWVPQIDGFESGTLSSYFVRPDYLDDIMLVNYNSKLDYSKLSDIYSTDPLIHEINFNVKKSSKMSTYGLINL